MSGAVFPDPLAVCQQQCDPNSRGRTNATQFIQWREFNDAITFIESTDLVIPDLVAHAEYIFESFIASRGRRKRWPMKEASENLRA